MLNTFEGYGIAGAGIIVDCLTNNNTRTVAEVRHTFNKYHGNMGTDGCVSFQFKRTGSLVLPWYERRCFNGRRLWTLVQKM